MATQESVKPRDQVIDYVVQSGDTVSSIGQKFDISEDTVRWANNLKGANPVVKPGEILKIPPVSGVVHKVQRGETIYSIAKKYQTEPQNIVNFPFNDFVDLENFTLSVSQTLIVPDGVIEEPDLPARTSPLRPKAPEYLAKQSVGQLLWPTTGSVTQQPVWYHMALDIANRAAPDVFAAESGTVSLATCYQWGYGCHIVVDHGDGMQTLYAHLSSFYVSSGQTVGRGDALGRMGSTGRSTGTHLHFEVRNGGVAINPWNYLQ
ncbi:MAG: LysM peptidoglycan-binding domain-containing M23 family metallopeptidase [Candidatus Roizmanbacteria bacterium]|nr:LysM peptidoglycan-binding domain-containing M23 family metallopeptidase [Candidatus Roizmanbacteria bacterium]